MEIESFKSVKKIGFLCWCFGRNSARMKTWCWWVKCTLKFFYDRRNECGASTLTYQRFSRSVCVITWICSQAATGSFILAVCFCFENKENNACQFLGSRCLAAVVTCCQCFVCLFFFLAPPPLPHALLSPTWNDAQRNKKSCSFFCATDPSHMEAAEAVDNRSLEEILGSIPPPPPPAMTNEPGAPRLMITHLVNRNFKSYAGEQILGPFHKVRPNMVTNVNSVWGTRC